MVDRALLHRSGASLLAALKADPDTASVPVLVVSAMTDILSARRRALAAAVIAKPFDPAELVEVVEATCAPARGVTVAPE